MKPCRHCPFRIKVEPGFEAVRCGPEFWSGIVTVDALVGLVRAGVHPCHMMPAARPHCIGGQWFLGRHEPEQARERAATVFGSVAAMREHYS